MMQGKPNREIIVCRDAAALATTVVDKIIDAASEAIATRGRFTLVLSGGSTPKAAYALLAERKASVDWSKTWLFFGDERVVPHDDARSNYHLASESLLRPAGIAREHVFAVPTHLPTSGECAAAYESTLRSFFNDAGDATFPAFDLVLLGLGDDGHTASLFPGKPAVHEKKAWVTWSPPGVLPPPVDRVTLTLPTINSARKIAFLVGGAGKATIVGELLASGATSDKYPAGLVQPTHGHAVWLLDEAAASQLSPEH